MKIKTVLISTTILSALALGSSQVTTVYADDNPQQVTTDENEDEATNSGNYGDVHWSIDGGTLTISGGTLPELTGDDLTVWGYPKWHEDRRTDSVVTQINITGTLILPSDSTNMFSNFENLKSITGLNNLDTSKVTTFDNMFASDPNLFADGTLDLSKLKTPKATSMSSMFDGCGAKDIKLSSSFDTSGVSDMDSMFANLPNATTLDLSNFNTSNVTNMGMMFSTDKKLSKLDLSNFKTPLVTHMDDMFSQSPNLTSLDLSNFTSRSDGYYSNMFQNNTNLSSLDISKFDLSNIDSSKQESMFSGDALLSDIKLKPNSSINESAGIPDTGKQMIDLNTINSDSPTKKSLKEVLENSGSDGKWAQIYSPSDTDPVKISVGNDIDDSTQEISVPTNKFMYIGQTIPVDVKPDAKSGYTPKDPQTINVTLSQNYASTPDSTGQTPIVQTFNTTDKLIYTKKSTDNNSSSGNSHHSSGSHNSGTSTPTKETPKVTDSDQYVTVKHNIDDASLYNSDQDILTNRALAHDSSWFSNEVMTYKGQTYYQVATNEWVKANDVYVYQKTDNIVRTKNKEITYLKNISGSTISNRGLAANTDWKADQLVQIDGQAYYRVATNEFVSTNDVTVL